MDGRWNMSQQAEMSGAPTTPRSRALRRQNVCAYTHYRAVCRSHCTAKMPFAGRAFARDDKAFLRNGFYGAPSPRLSSLRRSSIVSMSQERDDQERPCLHCMMVELIDDFLAENPSTLGSDKVDTGEADEVIDAIAKTVAELTSQQDGVIRQQVIEELLRQIKHYDAEFRREGATSAVGSSSVLKNVEIGALAIFLPWGLGQSGCCEQTLTYAVSSLGMRIRL